MRNVQVRRGAYVDSVTLMQVSRRVAALDGVASALVAMATELNLDLAAGMGFDLPDTSPNELLVAVDASSDEVLAEALAEVDAAMAEASRPAATGFGSAPAPTTVRAAARTVTRDRGTDLHPGCLRLRRRGRRGGRGAADDGVQRQRAR